MNYNQHLLVNLKSQLNLYLEKKELSAAQLAKKSGVSKQVISLWLNGGSPRKIQQIKLVADALGTTVDQLCFGTGLLKSLDSSGFENLPTDEWLSGLFEIKIRRVKK